MDNDVFHPSNNHVEHERALPVEEKESDSDDAAAVFDSKSNKRLDPQINCSIVRVQCWAVMI